MRSKYLIIEDSDISDAYGNLYPDVMTFPINKFVYSEIPVKVAITSVDIARFDLFCYRYYGTCDYTDLLLWLNNKSTVHELETGEELTLPTANDINKFYITNL